MKHLLSFALAALISSSAFAQQLLTQKERDNCNKRWASGPYKSVGDAGVNTPGDAATMLQFANQFRANPIVAGNNKLESLTIWSGFSGGIVSETQHPVWQGVKMTDAAQLYWLGKGSSYGEAVRTCLLAQVRINAADISTYYVPSSNARVYFDLFPEAKFLQRLVFAYDVTNPLYTSNERLEIEAYFKRAADYYVVKLRLGPIGQCWPNREQGDYTVAGRDAGINGWLALPDADKIYGQADGKIVSTGENYGDVYGDGYKYTHRNANGTLGNKIPRLASHYNNRVSDEMGFVGALGIVLAEQGTSYVNFAVLFHKELITYGTFPDGTISDYERNGDYYNPHQGADYCYLIMWNYLFLADQLAKRGDLSLMAFSTTTYRHGPAGTRSIQRVMLRAAKNCLGMQPIYYKTVTLNNKIDPVLRLNGKYAPWHTQVLAIYARFASGAVLDTITWAAENVFSKGGFPLPGKNYTTAESVYYCWGGTSAQIPAAHILYARTGDLDLYNLRTPLKIAGGDTTLAATPDLQSWSLKAPAIPGATKWFWTAPPNTGLTLANTRGRTLLINDEQSQALTVGQYNFKLVVTGPTLGKREIATTLTIAP